MGFSPRRSILSQSGYGTPAFSSALSSASRLSAAPNVQVSTPPATLAAKSKIPRMKSHMLADGTEVPKPWTEKKNPRATFSYWIVYFIVFIGIAGGAVQCYFTYIRVPLDRQPLCIVLDENFDNEDTVFGDNGTFFREVNMDGFGYVFPFLHVSSPARNRLLRLPSLVTPPAHERARSHYRIFSNGEFEMTTTSRNNSFIKDGMLYIVPTLTSDNIGTDAVFDGTVYNITGCTFNQTRPDNGFIIQDGERVFDSDSYYRSCSAVSNSTAGTVINPVQSARLTTQKSASIRYGRVEIRAKMPNGCVYIFLDSPEQRN